jgi:hypothetical protein
MPDELQDGPCRLITLLAKAGSFVCKFAISDQPSARKLNVEG